MAADIDSPAVSVYGLEPSVMLLLELADNSESRLHRPSFTDNAIPFVRCLQVVSFYSSECGNSGV